MNHEIKFKGSDALSGQHRQKSRRSITPVADPCPTLLSRATLESAGIVLLSFSSSVALINSTKWLFFYEAFQYPMFITCTHAIFSYYFSYLGLFRLEIAPLTHKLTLKQTLDMVFPFAVFGVCCTKVKAFPRQRLHESCRNQGRGGGCGRWGEEGRGGRGIRRRIMVVFPWRGLHFVTAESGALSIACGNLALVYLYPSFHEMIQNTTPFWTLVVMSTVGRVDYNRWSYLAMVPVCGGGILCGLGELNWNLLGVGVSLGCVGFRALRVWKQAAMLCEGGGGREEDVLGTVPCPQFENVDSMPAV